LSSLDAEDFEQLWDVLVSGTSPMNLKHIRYLYAGRRNVIQVLERELDRFFRESMPLRAVVIRGERGTGKTFTAFYMISRIKESYGVIIPIYISFDSVSSPLDFVSKLFYELAFGLLPLIEEESYRERVRLLLERFGVDITYAKIKPGEAEAPIGLLRDLCDIASEHGAKVCIVLDELDLLADPQSAVKIHASFEKLLGFQNYAKIHKMYVLCATSRALEELKSRRGYGFVSRIWSALENAAVLTLPQLTEKEKEEIVGKVVEIYRRCYREDLSAFPLINSIIRNRVKDVFLPREVITVTAETLNAYNAVREAIKESSMMISGISTGIEVDTIFKKRLLPIIDQIFPSIKYRTLEGEEYPSLLFGERMRRIDGEFMFPDGFTVGVEVKYSATRATLDDSDVDQILSYLKRRRDEGRDAEGVFILLGTFSEDPVKDRQKENIRRYGMEGKVHVFLHPGGADIIRNLQQLLFATNRVSLSELRYILSLILGALGLDKYLRDKVRQHKVKRVEVVKKLEEPRKVERRIKLKVISAKVRGLGPKTVEKLEQIGVEYVDQFLSMNPEEIYQKLIASFNVVRIKPYKIKQWQTIIREYLQA